MIRFKMMLLMVVVCAAVAAAQPCDENHGCFENHFCDLSTYVCRPCLNCKVLKREELSLKEHCIKSIKECGPCLDDLVDSKEDGVSCVPRAEGAPPADSSATLWIVAGVVIVIFVVVAAAVVIRYMFRNSSIFKLHLDTNIGATLPTHVVATAPESPPPYSPNHVSDLHRPGEDTEHPLIKPYQPPFPAYESQDHQNVSVFNPPAYVRLHNRSDQPRPQEEHSDVNDNYPLPAHDEDTTPSPWAPGADYTVATPGPAASPPPPPPEAAAAADLSSALAAARNTDLIQPSQVTLRMQTMNGNEESTNGEEPHAHNTQRTSRTQGNLPGNYNVMNVNQIITIIKPPLDKQMSF